jgi:lipoprotein NlpI
MGDWRHCLASEAAAHGETFRDFRQRDGVHILVWMARTRLGEAKEASKELAAYRQERSTAGGKDWGIEVMGYLLDEIDEPALLAAAKSSDAMLDHGQHCEAWFFAGMKHLFAKDNSAAGDCFRKAAASEMINFNEYAFAQAELKALGQP